LKLLPSLRHLAVQGWADAARLDLAGLALISLECAIHTGRPTDFDWLSHFTTLRTLHLRSGYLPGKASLTRLASLERLEVLSFPTNCGTEEAEALADLPALHALEFPTTSKFSAKTAHVISRMNALDSLTIHAPGCDDLAMQHLSRLARLRELNVRDCSKVTDKSLPHLGKMNLLESVDVCMTGITDEGIRKFPLLPHLRRINHLHFGVQPPFAFSMPMDLHRQSWSVPEGGLTVTIAKQIAAMPAPPSLNFHGASPAAAIRALANSQLTRLFITGKQPGWECIADMPKLCQLDAHQVNAAVLYAIAQLPLLTHLLINQDEHGKQLERTLAAATSLRSVELQGRAVTDDVIAILPILPALAEVSLDACAITDAGIRRLAASRTVNKLWIRGCVEIGDGALDALGAAEQIEDLFIESGVATGAGFSSWNPTHRLSSIHLDISSFGDIGLEHLSRLRHLESINMSSAATTDRSWDHLLALPELSSIALYRCKKMTHPALIRFEAALRAAQREVHIGHDIPKRVALDQVVSRKREQQLKKRWSGKKPFHAENPGELNDAVRIQLKRLGASPGKAPALAATFPSPLRELIGYQWPEGSTFANDDVDGDDGVSSLEFGFDSVNKWEELLCLQERRFISVAHEGGGDSLLMIPLDTEMAEDPPVYLVAHDWYENEDADSMKPLSLSDFLRTLTVG